MAKKRKKTDAEKEEKEYRPPEFDERKFIAEEINIARAVILGAIMSFPMGIAAFFVSEAVGTSFGGLIVLILGIVLIKLFMPMFKVDEVLFKPKHWLSVISTYFFAFLAVWVLVVNPPFSDFAGPQIMQLDIDIEGPMMLVDGNLTENITHIDVIYKGKANYTQINEYTLINVTAGWENLTITAEITDNSDDYVSNVQVNGQQVNPVNNIFTFTMQAGSTTLPADVNITSYDSKDNFSTFLLTIAET